jgi:hypothetical protein
MSMPIWYFLFYLEVGENDEHGQAGESHYFHAQLGKIHKFLVGAVGAKDGDSILQHKK